MKSLIKTLSIAIITVCLLIPAASADDTAPGNSAVSVGRLLSNVEQYPGNVNVQGIVNTVSPEKNIVEIADPHHSKMGATKSCSKTCYKEAKTCPMTKGEKCSQSCEKTCSKAEREKCDKACEKPCSMAEGKKCDKTCAKTCPMAEGKECVKSCTKQCPKASAVQEKKTCPHAAAKTGCASAHMKTLVIQWSGDMPEVSVPVSAVGKITQKDGRTLFIAESLKVLSN